MEEEQSKKPATRLTHGDWCVGLLLVALAAGMLFFPCFREDTTRYLEVITREETSRYSLSEDRTFTVASADITLTVAIEKGEVRVLTSTCPNQVCVASGAIHREGESILCAPAGVALVIHTEEVRPDDAIAG